MSRKYVNLFVQSNKVPFTLQVLSQRGEVLAQKRIFTTFSTHCLVTCESAFYLGATFGTNSISRFVTLSCAKCQNLSSTFTFPTPQVFVQTFTLTDQNYSFPIPIATLNFTT